MFDGSTDFYAEVVCWAFSVVLAGLVFWGVIFRVKKEEQDKERAAEERRLLAMEIVKELKRERVIPHDWV